MDVLLLQEAAISCRNYARLVTVQVTQTYCALDQVKYLRSEL